jgi:uncharacterized protein YbdZ (MbtH family)
VKYRPKDASEKGQQIWLKLPTPEKLPTGWEEKHDSVKGDGGYSWVSMHNQKNVVKVRPTKAAVRPKVPDGWKEEKHASRKIFRNRYTAELSFSFPSSAAKKTNMPAGWFATDETRAKNTSLDPTGYRYIVYR